MRQRPSSLSVLAAISSGVVAFLGLTLSTATLAQEEEASAPASSGGGVDQIVVTAEFRETNLQDTPIAITAVTGDMMEARSQTNIFEVAAQAPNVTLKPQGQENGNGIIAFIRGVGQTDFNYALEPGVGIYVDDV
ncbi:MAG: TonB-dependent receptor plug domain-containing protein, partial [Amphiplicatus sp.]|nr:TonB-dependent receptor plug domain-containing protein [Amphiplicatus sp.]